MEIQWPYKTGDCLIQVTTWEGLTVNVSWSKQLEKEGIKGYSSLRGGGVVLIIKP